MSWDSINRQTYYKLYLRDKNGDVLSELTGFISGNCNFDSNTDVRRIAQIVTKNDNYPENKFPMVQIKAFTNEDDVADLGTYTIKDVKYEQNRNDIQKTYDLWSICYKAQTSILDVEHHFTGLWKLKDIIAECGIENEFVKFVYEQGVENWTHNYGEEGLVIESGKDCLSVLKQFCNDYDCVYDIDDINICIRPYINPSTKPATFNFAYNNGTIVEGKINITKDKFSTINRAIAVYTSNEIKIVGVANADPSSGVSIPIREQIIAQKWDENSANPANQEELDKLAKNHLERSIRINNSYEFTGIFMGLKEGDVGTLRLVDGSHKCVIEKISPSLDEAMATQYKLKEVFE